MSRYYKATRRDGTSFADGKTRLAVGHTLSVEPIGQSVVCVHKALDGTPQIGRVLYGHTNQWPCRVFEVEANTTLHNKWVDGYYCLIAQASSCDVVREVDPTLMFGPEGRRVARVLEQIRGIGKETIKQLRIGWRASLRGPITAIDRSEVRKAIWCQDLDAAYQAAKRQCCKATKASDAIGGLMVSGLINPSGVRALMRPWVDVMGYPEPMTDDEVRGLCGAEFVGDGAL